MLPPHGAWVIKAMLMDSHTMWYQQKENPLNLKVGCCGKISFSKHMYLIKLFINHIQSVLHGPLDYSSTCGAIW